MKQLLRYLPYLPWTVWFNFRYLPLRQAVRLPILLRKPRLLRCGGRIRIEGPVHTGGSASSGSRCIPTGALRGSATAR